jgi:hypothetical protein
VAGKTFQEYRDIIINTIMSSENILKAITVNHTDFLDSQLIVPYKNIPYNYIYPYKASCENIDTPKTILTMSFNNFKFDGVKLKSGKIFFYTICHVSLIKTDYGNRYDYIYDCLNTLFNNNPNLGIGKAKMTTADDMTVSDTQLGNMCCLEITDFGV